MSSKLEKKKKKAQHAHQRTEGQPFLPLENLVARLMNHSHNGHPQASNVFQGLAHGQRGRAVQAARGLIQKEGCIKRKTKDIKYERLFSNTSRDISHKEADQ